LKNGNIIDTIRGPKGGYVLKKPPSQITMLEIVEVLQGSIELIECTKQPSACHRMNKCATRPVWKKMQEAQEEVLRSFTIQDLLDMEVNVDSFDYSI
ncbi:MAG: Rrf2 family transcriptional regulator, partial [bacterium]|nr:Rrf2 family transcriptional regulator [bacterium]